MPWVCFTHSAMIGSRDRPCSEYRFPPNELPYCFSRATARMDAREASFAASVAVTPWARARSHSLWLVASATTRRSTGWLIPPGWGAQEGGAGRGWRGGCPCQWDGGPPRRYRSAHTLHSAQIAAGQTIPLGSGSGLALSRTIDSCPLVPRLCTQI